MSWLQTHTIYVLIVSISTGFESQVGVYPDFLSCEEARKNYVEVDTKFVIKSECKKRIKVQYQ